jgi:hypothetical protein
MVKLKRKEGKLTVADLASYGIVPKQPDESKPVKSQESETRQGQLVQRRYFINNKFAAKDPL